MIRAGAVLLIWPTWGFPIAALVVLKLPRLSALNISQRN